MTRDPEDDIRDKGGKDEVRKMGTCPGGGRDVDTAWPDGVVGRRLGESRDGSRRDECGSALDPDVLTEAGIQSMGTFIALTNNGEVNLVLAQRVMEEFQPPKVLAVFPQSNSNSSTSKIKVEQAFMPQLSTQTWNKYINNGEFQLGKIVFRKPQMTLQQAHFQALIRSNELLPLIVKREGKLQIVKAVEKWQPDDEVYCLLHDPRSKLLKRLSGSNQSSRLALDKFPEVEKISVTSNGTLAEKTN